MKERSVCYFDNFGEENTAAVIDVVARRLEESDVDTVVLASSSGNTALTFADALGGRARLICVSECAWVRRTLNHEAMAPDVRARLAAAGVEITHIPHTSGSFSWIGMDNVYGATDLSVLVYDVFRMVGGQGFKVAMEVGQMACNAGLLEPGTPVIAVGGTMRGADCAIVMKSAFSNDIFNKDAQKRPEMLELLCMPAVKSWFW